MSNNRDYNFETESLVEEPLLASRIINDLKINSKVEIKEGKLIRIKIIFKDESEIYHKVQRNFYNKYLKKYINLIL